MNEKNIVICDGDFRYADSLARNICGRKELAVNVHICKNLQEVRKLSKKKTIHIFITGEQYTQEKNQEVKSEQTFVLGKDSAEDLGEATAVYKYQNADEIIRIILERYVAKTKENVTRSVCKDRTKFIAVYSPIHRIGKTHFALELGKAYAKKGRTLYLNMEEYGGFTEEDGSLNLGDLLYYIKQGNKNLGIRLGSSVKKMEELDYVLPIPMVPDLKEVTCEEWRELLQQIAESGSYEVIILEPGEGVQGLFPFLELCDRVYMPILEDEVSKRKVQQYLRNIEKLGLEQLKTNTYQFVMPEDIQKYAKWRVKEEW